MSAAVVYVEPGVVTTGVVPERELGPRDVRIDVEACGVCGSDLASFAHGHYIEPGQIMGHELAGRVAEAGEERTALIGRRVTVRPMQSCGTCSYCRAGAAHLCGATYGPSLGYGTPGAFAEQVVLSEAEPGVTIFPVPDEVDPFDLLWAEPFAVALHAVDLAGPAREILVTGAGAVGLTVMAAARVAGMRVTAVEPLAGRRAAAETLGAATFEPGALPDGARFDALVDASGVPAAVRAALPFLRGGAPVVMVGLNDDPIAFPCGDHPVRGSFAYLQKDFVRSVELIASGEVRLSHLVTDRLGLDRAADALRGPAAGDATVKAAIVPQRGSA
ncbi:alcohol dehydrogenase catalytic domain-containing protein [Protaetiibacter sp. SSC-01]|uniref:zinc-dependent alcohol dehydrogenase n=1 Tax=Protaetiibacter sp. SSC-01 TaxID=2759943 RepID=UPI001656BD9D|nr:alcohol dehydrogenase catalytic domain-containing protein [Protaetiibacter sp. SSC-01]QNO38323.1 alcohol dehydrogenase catalytic domain-containing protein [Protaetiibacter sp. SSC-01]